MKILALKTDQPEARLTLLDDNVERAQFVWHAHRTLAKELLAKIEEFLRQNGEPIVAINGIVFFHGPGSFTGLRIGGSVANALGYGLDIPVVATGGEHWIEAGVRRLAAGENDKIVDLQYGGQIHITTQKK